MDKQEQQVVVDELSEDQLAQAAGGMINVRAAIVSTVKGGALNGTRSGGDDDLDDLEVER